MRSSARDDKLAAALRENLKRRKARARALQSAEKQLDEATPADAASPPGQRPNIAPKAD